MNLPMTITLTDVLPQSLILLLYRNPGWMGCYVIKMGELYLDRNPKAGILSELFLWILQAVGTPFLGDVTAAVVIIGRSPSFNLRRIYLHTFENANCSLNALC